MGRRMRDPALGERRAVIQSLLLAGCTIAQCIEYGAQRGWSDPQVRKDCLIIQEEWSKQNEDELQHSRAQAIQRLRADLVQMRLKMPLFKPKKGTPERAEYDASWKDIVAHEALLARIEGTLRPIEVKVDVRGESRRALIDVINAMSPEEMDRLVEEQREIERRASGKG